MRILTRLNSDPVTPDLRRRLKALAPESRRRLLEALGMQLAGMAKRAHTDAGLRPSPWPNLKSGRPSTLQQSARLRQAHRVISVTANSVTVGNDAPYAAVHQLGGRTPPRLIKPKRKKALNWPGARHPVKSVKHPGANIPARPVYPFLADGRPTPRAEATIRGIIRRHLEAAGRA